ncbi:MAG: hypothetical protein GY854_01830 [Deltaproteobacteria bacterium]|nr:hypothetical protein [Deltaproteobacteria bacterium]
MTSTIEKIYGDPAKVPPGDYFDDRGRIHTPWIERGNDNVPKSINVPSADLINKMSTGQKSRLLGKMGYADSWDLELAKQRWGGFGIDSKDPQFQHTMGALQKQEGARALGNVRRMAERHETMTAAQGDMNTVMIYMTENPDACDACVALEGTEKTYREFVEDGDQPADRCYGEDRCMCSLMPVSKPKETEGINPLIFVAAAAALAMGGDEDEQVFDDDYEDDE